MKIIFEIDDSQADCLKQTVAAAHGLDVSAVDEDCIAEHCKFTLVKQMKATVVAQDREAVVKKQLDQVDAAVPVDMSRYAVLVAVDVIPA